MAFLKSIKGGIRDSSGKKEELVISSPNTSTFRQGVHMDEKAAKNLQEKGPISLDDLDELQGLSEEDIPAILRIKLAAAKAPVAKSPAKPTSSTRKSGRSGDMEISGPHGPAQHKLHVSTDWVWSGTEAAGAFRLLDKLGEGAYGSVYKAIHKDSGFVLAIKMILLGKNQGDVKKEIDILKRCSHENIVRYFGSSTHDNYLWIMMDYCGAGSLQDLIKHLRITFSEAQIGYVMAQALKGLEYLHAQRIIHRDIKAGNLLLTEDGKVKLADFGVSAQLNASLTRSRSFVGTALWMSPEVLEQEPYDQRADIWAMGITGIELADGLPPHYEKQQMRAIFLIPQLPPPTVRDPTRFSSLFNDFIARALVKDPNQRPNAVTLLAESPFLAQGRNATFDVMKEPMEKLKAHREGEKSSSPSPSAGNSPSTSLGEKDRKVQKDAAAAEAAEAAMSPRSKGARKSDAKGEGKGEGKGETLISAPKYVGQGEDPQAALKAVVSDLRAELQRERAKTQALAAELTTVKDKYRKTKRRLKQTSDDLRYAESDIAELEAKAGPRAARPSGPPSLRVSSSADSEEDLPTPK
jgi:serine/threonine protein kinase